MAEPLRQVEVQLGHLCNNRCVFCVSGQLSEQKRAPQLPAEPIRRQLKAARENGATKITFLGGEPTMQRDFLDLLAFAVELDFHELVIFTNGTMTPRDSFRERVFEVLQGLGPRMLQRVIWRFSLQGGSREAHDITTVNPGAWDRIVQSLDLLQAQGARLTGNMCVVTSNYESIAELAAVAAHYRFENLHLDMVRPRDSGDRTDAWLKSIMARYTDMAPSFLALESAVVGQLGADFDLNFGNVPYCTMPEVAHRIHHDGQDTVTVAADGQGNTQEGFDKYADKRSDKHKPAGCAQCVFDDVCSGVFDKYREFYGDTEFTPITPGDLWRRDVNGHHFVRLALPALRTLEAMGQVRVLRVDEQAAEIDVDLEGWRATLRRPTHESNRQKRASTPGWFTLTSDRVEVVLVGPPGQTEALQAALSRLEVLGGTELACDVAALQSAWHLATVQRQAERQRQDLALRTVTTLADQLRAQPLAGMRPQGVQRTADGLGFEVRFAAPTGSLRLTIRAERSPDGQWRPRFRHEVESLPESMVAAFNAALAGRLKSLSARPVV